MRKLGDVNNDIKYMPLKENTLSLSLSLSLSLQLLATMSRIETMA